MENPMDTGIYKRFTKGRGRPRKALEDIDKSKPNNRSPKQTDMIEFLLEKNLITPDMHRACIIYRTLYFQFCRLAYVPRLGQITYGEARGGQRKTAPYPFAGKEGERDQVLEQRYLTLRQSMGQGSDPSVRLFHNWLLFSEQPHGESLDLENLKAFRKICQLLVKGFKTYW